MAVERKMISILGSCLIIGMLGACGTETITDNAATNKNESEDTGQWEMEGTTFDPYRDGAFSTFTDEECQVDREQLLSDLHQDDNGYNTVWLETQEVYGGYNSVEEKEIKVGEPGTHDRINFIGTVLGMNNTCYISYESSVFYCLWRDGWKTETEERSGLYTYDFSGLNGTYWKTQTGNMTQNIGRRLFGDDIFDGKEIPSDATLYIALDGFDSVIPIDNFHFGGSGKMADAIMVSDGQVIASGTFDFTGNDDVFVTVYDAKEAYVSCYFISFSLMGDDMAWDFTLKEGSIVQIDSDEYEKATQGGISTSVEPNGNTSEQDVTDFVYGMYEYRDGSEYLIAEVGYSFETDCDYVIIYYYYEDNDAVCEVLNLSRNADGTYTGEGTEYSTVATVTFTDEAMNVFIDSTDEPACEKMTANYVLTSEIDYNM